MEAAKLDLKEIQAYLTGKLGFSKEDCEKVIEFRHWMHQNAEGHLKEFNTQAKIKEMLISLGGF